MGIKNGKTIDKIIIDDIPDNLNFTEDKAEEILSFLRWLQKPVKDVLAEFSRFEGYNIYYEFHDKEKYPFIAIEVQLNKTTGRKAYSVVKGMISTYVKTLLEDLSSIVDGKEWYEEMSKGEEDAKND
jgi:hypothetical protein